MIQLHQFRRAFGVPNPSPFCMKVETYLRLAGLPYELVPLDNPAKAPKGKAPFLTDGDTVVPDSHFILGYLKRTFGDPLGEGLDARTRAEHHALARMVEEHLVFTVMYMRWMIPQNASILRDVFFGGLHPFVRGAVFRLVQKTQGRALKAQGMGRHSEAEINQLAVEDLQALSDILGDSDYFGGEAPREIDCVTWASIANVLVPPFQFPAREAALAMTNLGAYHDRMMRAVFPELADAS